MSEWKEYNITDVCDTISDTYRDNAEKVVLINTSDVLEGKVTNHDFVPNKNLAGQFKKKFQKDDILYSEIRPANKRYAYVDFEPKDYIASTKLMVLRSKPCILSKYLYYLLTNNTTIQKLHAIAVGRSGTFPQITYSELVNIKFLLPSIGDQEEILSTLLTFDDKIANNRRICENLEAQAQALFKHWFIDFAPFKDGKFVESELGMIPEGWRVDRLGSIIVENEKSRIQVNQASTSGMFPFFTSGEKILKYNDFLVTGRNIFLNTGGIAGVKYRIGKSAYSTDTWCIKGDGSYTDFLYLYLSRNVELLNRRYFEGSALKHLQKKSLKDRLIIIPSVNCLKEFNSIVNVKLEMIEHLKDENLRLTTLRDTLLPKLMSGEIKL